MDSRPRNADALSFAQEKALRDFCRADAAGFGLPEDPGQYEIVVRGSAVYAVVPGNDYSDLAWQGGEWIPL